LQHNDDALVTKFVSRSSSLPESVVKPKIPLELSKNRLFFFVVINPLIYIEQSPIKTFGDDTAYGLSSRVP
jgi:hypothetical protein